MMFLAPGGAVQIQHISALRFGQGYAFKVGKDVVIRKVHIGAENLAQFIDPLLAFLAVRADEGVHGHYILGIVVGQGGLLSQAVS